MLRFHHFPDSSRQIGLSQMIGVVGPGYAHHGTPEKEMGDHPRPIQASVFRLNMKDSTRVFRVGIESLKHPVRLSPGKKEDASNTRSSTRCIGAPTEY